MTAAGNLSVGTLSSLVLVSLMVSPLALTCLSSVRVGRFGFGAKFFLRGGKDLLDFFGGKWRDGRERCERIFEGSPRFRIGEDSGVAGSTVAVEGQRDQISQPCASVCARCDGVLRREKRS